MNPTHLSNIETTLSSVRLASYGTSVQTALKLHLLNTKLSCTLFETIQYVELALRNNINRYMCSQYGDCWFDTSVLMNGYLASKVKEIKSKGKKTTINHNYLTSNASLGFWLKLFDRIWKSCSQNSGQPLKTTLKTLFPGWTRQERDPKRISSMLENFRTIRNRIGHHEKIIHISDIQDQHAHFLNLMRGLCPHTHTWVVQNLNTSQKLYDLTLELKGITL